MCDVLGQPTTVAEAMAMLDRALDHLNAADAASLPGAVQADVLRGPGRRTCAPRRSAVMMRSRKPAYG
jgi:hypothetical protein